MARTPDDRDRQWLAEGEALLRLAGAADSPSVAGGRLYQLAVAPTFATPCVLTFDDRDNAIDASLAIVGQDALAAACRGEVPTGRVVQFSDVATVPDTCEVAVRTWATSLDPREFDRPRRHWRDGTAFFIRVVGPEPLWVYLDNPTSEEFPTHMHTLSGMADVAMRTFPNEPVRSYLANVLRGSGGPAGPRRPA